MHHRSFEIHLILKYQAYHLKKFRYSNVGREAADFSSQEKPNLEYQLLRNYRYSNYFQTYYWFSIYFQTPARSSKEDNIANNFYSLKIFITAMSESNQAYSLIVFEWLGTFRAARIGRKHKQFISFSILTNLKVWTSTINKY